MSRYGQRSLPPFQATCRIRATLTVRRQCFCKKDLPKECRIIRPGQMVTKDLNENRLNVCVDDSNNVTNVYHG
jgi:hypothetical protein